MLLIILSLKHILFLKTSQKSVITGSWLRKYVKRQVFAYKYWEIGSQDKSMNQNLTNCSNCRGAKAFTEQRRNLFWLETYIYSILNLCQKLVKKDLAMPSISSTILFANFA